MANRENFSNDHFMSKIDMYNRSKLSLYDLSIFKENLNKHHRHHASRSVDFGDVEKIENSFISWNVYPNPADDNVTIEVSDDVLIDAIELVDLTGRVVKDWTWNTGSKMNLELNDVPKGYFIIQLYSGTQKWTKKLLID